MRRLFLVLATWWGLLSFAMAQQNPDGKLPTTAFGEPYVLLIRDPEVQTALKLSPNQHDAIQSLGDQLDLRFWTIRNQSADRGNAIIQELTDEAKQKMATILSAEQAKRLEQIRLQIRGTKVLQDAAVRKFMAFSNSQNEKLDGIFTTRIRVWISFARRRKPRNPRRMSKNALRSCCSTRTSNYGRCSRRTSEIVGERWSALLSTQPRLDASNSRRRRWTVQASG